MDDNMLADADLRGDGYTIHGRTVGAMPNQIEGLLDDGRLFYFRARHGHWTLRVAAEAGDELYIGSPLVQGDAENAGWWSAAETLEVFKKAIAEVSK
jgi:hypothetical protein